MKTNISQGRINQEIRNMLKQPLPYLKATPLENDIYTWHFTIQGPENSDFHEGLYHGQILLPFQYPFKPPDIVFMNKNARFQTNTKICLTITQYHPEEWNSAWTIRTMLEAVISLFNQNIQGIGNQEGSPQQRRHLARKSHDFKCDKCGVLKDIIKFREPMKEEDKKEEPKQLIETPKSEKMEYASDMSLRKVRTQDKRVDVPKKLFEGSWRKQSNPARSQMEEEQVPKDRSQQKRNFPKNIIRIVNPNNDSFVLDQRIQKNYVSWARVLKSQKWSSIN